MQSIVRPASMGLDTGGVVRHAVLFVAYAAAVQIGLLFVMPQANLSLVWPAAGVGLTGVWLLGPWASLTVGLASLAMNLHIGHAALPSLSVAVGAGTAALIGAWGLWRARFDPNLARLGDVVRLTLIGVLGASVVSSLVGATVMYSAGLTEWQGFGSLWWVCWVADLMGTLLVAPTLFTWSAAGRRGVRACLRPEPLLLTLSIAVAAWAIYADVLPSGIAMARPLSYVIFPLMIWAAVRTGPRQAALLLAIHGAVAVALTAGGHGPFAGSTLRDNLLSLHAHLAMLDLTTLLLAAVLAERVAAERALIESEAKYRLLVENQTDLVVKTDAAGRILFASPSVAEAFGRPAESLVGAPFRRLVPEADADDPLSPWHALAAPPWACYLEQPAETRHGRRWLAWAAKAILDETGSPCGAVAVGRDVTERRAAEDASREYLQELAHVARLSAMGEMAAGLAHELNQPLCAITTYSQACLRIIGDETRPETRRAIERIAVNAQRAGDIIRQMRAFVRKDEPETGDLDINAVVREVVELTESQARHAAVEVAVHADPAVPLARGASLQIHQVLVNLVRNAIEALQSGPPTGRRIDVVTSAEKGFVVVEVSDNGPGLPPDIVDTVFEPFVTGKRDGLGLGLSISRSIIENHGGALAVSNRDGDGARFTFRLPAATPREQREARRS